MEKIYEIRSGLSNFYTDFIQTQIFQWKLYDEKIKAIKKGLLNTSGYLTLKGTLTQNGEP